MKLIIIRDGKTGYILDFMVYIVRTTDAIPQRDIISGAVVETLMAKYLNKGHTVWVNSWYFEPQTI
jgi:hypothetical protein